MVLHHIILQSDLSTLFGIDRVTMENFLELIIRISFNFVVITFIVRGLYYPVARRKDYLFSFILISIIVFLICFLLDELTLEIGFALGLFAIFAIIRYRTNPIPIKEMTYLFVVIGISVINALAVISYIELLFTNLAVILLIYFLERIWLLKHEVSKTIIYEKIELIKPEHRDALMEDLQKRTGLEIHRIEIGRVNFLRDTARIIIYYMDNGNSFTK